MSILELRPVGRLRASRAIRAATCLAIALAALTSCLLAASTTKAWLSASGGASIAFSYDDRGGARDTAPALGRRAIYGYDHSSNTFRVSRATEAHSPATKAGRGGAGPVRVGQAGEDAVRGAYDIGRKTKIDVGGRKRIPDGLTPTTLSEVKNVASLSYTQQLRDFTQYAQASGRAFDLFVRPGARLSGPLLDARAAGRINIREIPR